MSIPDFTRNGMPRHELWWDENVISGERYTIEQFKVQLGRNDSRKCYLEILRNGQSVLDVGCGPGLDYEMYCENNIDVAYVGIDVCRGFVEHNKAQHPEGNFICGKSYALPFADKTFDLVTARHVLEHLKEAEPTIREMCRVGKAVAIIWFIRPMAEENIVLNQKGHYSNTYSKIRLTEFINSLGFSVSKKNFISPQHKINQLWHITQNSL